MNIKVADLMVPQVITTQPHKTVGHVKGVMRNNGIKLIPVVNPEGEPVGVVSASDLLEDLSDNTPVSQIMTEKVYTVPQYSDVHIPARIMRNHNIHHVVVTHENEVVGMLSTFDLIQLVEDKRFTMKNAPTESSRKKKKRE